MNTSGFLLDEHLDKLEETLLGMVSIGPDSMNLDRYKDVTRRGRFNVTKLGQTQGRDKDA